MSDDGSLRSRAESKVENQKAWMEENDPGKLSPTEMRAIVAELHVHQIELEMQNEELRRAQQSSPCRCRKPSSNARSVRTRFAHQGLTGTLVHLIVGDAAKG